MRFSDWSSDVCSSDLLRTLRALNGDPIDEAFRSTGAVRRRARPVRGAWRQRAAGGDGLARNRRRRDRALHGALQPGDENGRASCRERGCQYVKISVVAGPLKKKKKK